MGKGVVWVVPVQGWDTTVCLSDHQLLLCSGGSDASLAGLLVCTVFLPLCPPDPTGLAFVLSVVLDQRSQR